MIQEALPARRSLQKVVHPSLQGDVHIKSPATAPCPWSRQAVEVHVPLARCDWLCVTGGVQRLSVIDRHHSVTSSRRRRQHTTTPTVGGRNPTGRKYQNSVIGPTPDGSNIIAERAFGVRRLWPVSATRRFLAMFPARCIVHAAEIGEENLASCGQYY